MPEPPQLEYRVLISSPNCDSGTDLPFTVYLMFDISFSDSSAIGNDHEGDPSLVIGSRSQYEPVSVTDAKCRLFGWEGGGRLGRYAAARPATLAGAG